jgi:pectin methylesterase-like acyl-CoA thioesterase
VKIKIISILSALILVITLSLVLAVPVGAAITYTVDDNWQVGVPPFAEDIDGDNDFATINAAINAASSGDTINVLAGTYKERIT